MVNILPNRDVLNQILKGAAQVVPDALEKYQQQKQRQQESQALSQFTGQNLSGLPSDVQKYAAQERIKGLEEERKYSNFPSAQGITQENDFFEVYKKMNPTEKAKFAQKYPKYAQAYDAEIKRQSKPPPGGISAQPVDPELAKLVGDLVSNNPDLNADQLQALLDQNQIPRFLSNSYVENRRRSQESEEKSKSKLYSDIRKETLPIRNEYANKAKYAKQAVENKNQLLKLLGKKQVDDPVYIWATSFFPPEMQNKLLSTNTQTYRSGLFEEFGILRNMFPGQIRVKEIELLEDKLASLEKSDAAKEEILKAGINRAKRDIILNQAAAKVEKDFPDLGPAQFEEKVSEIAQPKLDKLYDDLIETYDDIFIKYAPSKVSFKDQYGGVWKDIPKKDLELVMKNAKKDGYELSLINE